jgi:excisionase family DNA binding protein
MLNQVQKLAMDHITLESAANRSTQSTEPFLDCLGAAAVLGGVHPKTVERWARQGRIPAYRFFKRWSFRASELEVWMRSHVNSTCHPCRLKQEESDGT